MYIDYKPLLLILTCLFISVVIINVVDVYRFIMEYETYYILLLIVLYIYI